MNKNLLAIILTAAALTGCSSVPMESKEATAKAREFNAPAEKKAGFYVFRRDTFVGAALKKDVWLNKECVGETAKGVFFYKEVDGDQAVAVSTESEFSPNTLTVDAKSGNLYFVEQFIKMGAFVGGADVKLVHDEAGKSEIRRLKMAKSGKCSSELK
ncbi:DUF2846 domain-containing protein [Shewanella gelidii]|uniref:DUF2846 domain-containing protein n=1 Tax=Shewanella gelidii TaxID=1642821 RepID=A0A917JKA3_9GAMM|nr:DUF2846 domain-containing protein [Shewanella gelidii]MCL1097282.1 DUF2846 domain-containing protein [Shewanella gelidii]GGI73883.1 hypothetical protein GCM10009332_09250 [Shewanella gelidii]